MRGTIALAATAALLLVPSAAAADSIAYLQGGDIWVAAPDGSQRVRVTTDAGPYTGPSQADDGTIATSQRSEIVLLRHDGREIRRIHPPALVDAAGQPVDGVPANVAISPDGRTIAYVFTRTTCPPAATCATRSTMGYVRADGSAIAASGRFVRQPSFVTNSRVLAFAGFGSQVSLDDVGAPAGPRHWFDDSQHHGMPGTDLGDGELGRQGDRLALVRGYGDSAHVRWYRVTGDPRSGGVPPLPERACQTSAEAGIHGPSWSPDGTGLAIGAADGVHVMRNVPMTDACSGASSALVLPGASHPDWSPAPVHAAVPVPPVGGEPPAVTPAAPVATPPAAGGLRLTPVAGQRLRAVLRAGLIVRLTGPGAGTVTVRVRYKGRVVGSMRVRPRAGGRATVRVRLNPAGRRALGRVRRARLVVTAASIRTKVTVTR